jgi:hypothetical protein
MELFCSLYFSNTRWFKYDRDDLCVNKSQFVPVIFEPPCIYTGLFVLNLIILSVLYFNALLLN